MKKTLIYLLYKYRNKLVFNIRKRDELSNVLFIFTGEFGYEIVSWIPYLNFISKKYDFKPKVYVRNGCDFLYEGFAEIVGKISNNQIGDAFGDIKKQRFKSRVFTVNNHLIDLKKDIRVLDAPFLNTDIHSRIDTTHYLFPDLFVDDNLINYDRAKKYFTLNNKQHFNWDGSLRNFYNSFELNMILSWAKKCGYICIYNDPNNLVYDPSSKSEAEIEKQNVLRVLKEFDDILINLNDLENQSLDKRNRLQISAWKNSAFVVGVHGGSTYIPAFLKIPQYIVFRDGNYFDFLELQRINETEVKCYYECDTLIRDLDAIIGK